MKKKYRIKNRQNSTEFSKLTGIEAFQMSGGAGCLITRFNTISPSNTSIQKHAYRLYNDIKHKLGRNVKVTASCGAENCVEKSHLIAVYKPTEPDLEYIAAYGGVDEPVDLARRLEVSIELLKPFLK